MAWNPEEPYNSLPLLPPRGEVETKRVLKATIEARDALARFDARARALPNPTVLINAIPLLEAQASSEIENIVTTTDELFSAMATDTAASPAVREALRYRTALRVGFDQVGVRPLTAGTAAEVCTVIRGHDEGFRRGEVFIGDPRSRRRVYTPPAGRESLEKLLDNWSAFLNEPSDLDPLVRMAVAHYQFEAIHPFTDGNGRTGRIMNVLMLCDAGLLHLPLLYLSRYIIETKDEYYRLLGLVTSDEEWEQWVLYVVEGVRSTSVRTVGLIERIEEVQAALVDEVRRVLGSVNHDLVALLMEHPYARSRDVMERCEVSRPTAAKWLRALVATGALHEMRVGREVLFINVEMMRVLTS
jgi:Fic family protein